MSSLLTPLVLPPSSSSAVIKSHLSLILHPVPPPRRPHRPLLAIRPLMTGSNTPPPSRRSQNLPRCLSPLLLLNRVALLHHLAAVPGTVLFRRAATRPRAAASPLSDPAALHQPLMLQSSNQPHLTVLSSTSSGLRLSLIHRTSLRPRLAPEPSSSGSSMPVMHARRCSLNVLQHLLWPPLILHSAPAPTAPPPTPDARIAPSGTELTFFGFFIIFFSFLLFPPFMSL